MLSEHLGEGQHEVGCGGSRWQRVVESDADDDWGQQEQGLAEHAGFGLDATDAPSEDADAVDHGRVRVGPDQRVGQRHPRAVHLAHLHDLRQVLEVDLMDDAHPRGHDTEVAKCLLRPSKQRVALSVALVLTHDVAFIRLAIPEGVHLDGVVDHEIDRHERVDPHRITAGSGDGRAHRGQVDDRRNAREVLEEHPCRHEGTLAIGGGDAAVPARDRLDIAFAHRRSGRVANAVLEQDLERDGQPGHIADASFGERREAMVGNPRDQVRPGAEGICTSHHQSIFALETVDLTTTPRRARLFFSS